MITFEDDSELAARVSVRGRGTGAIPKGRYERVEAVFAEDEAQQVPTEIYKDSSRSIISTNDSPDLGFSASFNPYRGCEHGCIYCYARPFHEYLGFSAGLDFETKIFAKMEAPALLRKAFMAKSWQPQVLMISGVTDCYQPIERELKLTRQCLEVMLEFRNPGGVITKNFLVTRDIDILQELAAYNCIHVTLSITTLDKELSRRMEPRASQPERRLEAIRLLRDAGIPVSVNMAPIIPGLTDHEIPELLKRAAEAGAQSAHYTVVRLPHGVKDLFSEWLDEHYPLRKDKVMNRIRDVRGGKLYNSKFGERMKGEGMYAETIRQMFAKARAKYGLNKPYASLETVHFSRPQVQLSLF
ncbi:MAG: PA0069 family radical SAM protein [Rickettsiales bacterium]